MSKIISEWDDELGHCRLVRDNLLHYTERQDVSSDGAVGEWELVDQSSASERIADLIAGERRRQIELLEELTAFTRRTLEKGYGLEARVRVRIQAKLAELRAEEGGDADLG